MIILFLVFFFFFYLGGVFKGWKGFDELDVIFCDLKVRNVANGLFHPSEDGKFTLMVYFFC